MRLSSSTPRRALVVEIIEAVGGSGRAKEGGLFPPSSRALPHRREGGRDLFQRFALGVHGVERRDDGGGEHEDGGENVAAEDALPRPALDQLAENDRRSDAAEAGADGVKDSDGQSADLDREGLADGEISRTRRRRS